MNIKFSVILYIFCYVCVECRINNRWILSVKIHVFSLSFFSSFWAHGWWIHHNIYVIMIESKKKGKKGNSLFYWFQTAIIVHHIAGIWDNNEIVQQNQEKTNRFDKRRQLTQIANYYQTNIPIVYYWTYHSITTVEHKSLLWIYIPNEPTFTKHREHVREYRV